jgi:chaperonin cofactor prefoldin
VVKPYGKLVGKLIVRCSGSSKDEKLMWKKSSTELLVATLTSSSRIASLSQIFLGFFS